MRKFILPTLVILLATFAAPTQAATTFYTDRTAFEAASMGLTTEGFGDATLETGLSVTTSVGDASGGLWNDRPTPGGAQTTWSFSPGISAFGADFDLSPGGVGTGLRFLLNGTEELATQLQVFTPTFFGFITDAAFSSLLIQSGENGPFAIAETHTMDNLTFGAALPFAAAAAPAPVPLPAGFPLLLAAMGALGVSRRRQRGVSLT